MGDRGFTLLEVLVAFTLLSLVLGAAYASMGAGTKAVIRAGDGLEGLARAESFMNRLGSDVQLERGLLERREDGWTLTATIRPSTVRGQLVAPQSVPWHIVVSASPPGQRAPVIRLETLRQVQR